ncbi:NAD(P)H oxidoreductase [Mergibacter septicus]|uniref:NAD(P)H oxidoreductase n=1 Tax=Mergibacter septicus TaxID=221402 RepID=A0A8D4IZL1_9PAST|nr:NAD(P)H-dependent oxidoreductase [Mergibacter septicus]AWX15479.1 NAD(P)H oxidoreductase [Mergibacter septicus]QDJ14732.1 NAD(P)H oxidoreductase [Mergibacter septicus]UTU47840.1 NAD(P)H-dependent oxidoreductase [Mergibacter septicus]WMR96554.1 NAD(P)H-dependent oxidoreductase [Mergibacter septicus]
MQHLIIYSHPNPDSFNHAILERVIKASEGLAEVNVRDLYQLNFNPVLSLAELKGEVADHIRQEQQLITQADLVTLIYPLWWMGFPAILKGYLDRVLGYGFAYTSTENGTVGLLGDKKLQQFITLGNSVEQYQAKGFDRSLQHTLLDGLFNFCGITDIQYQMFGTLHSLSQQQRIALLDKVEQIVKARLTAS